MNGSLPTQRPRIAIVGAGMGGLATAVALHKVGLRAPLDRWFGPGMVLIGDAAHPMTPYMAQGAAMAIEDGVVLARALAAASDIAAALVVFQAAGPHGPGPGGFARQYLDARKDRPELVLRPRSVGRPVDRLKLLPNRRAQ